MKKFELSSSERKTLKSMLKSGSYRSVELMRAHVLLQLDSGKKRYEISQDLSIAKATVYNVFNRYKSGGLSRALYDAPRPGKPSQISPEERAKITALACSEAPLGHQRWTLRLLADRVVELGIVESISYEGVREILKKTNSNPT